MDAKTPFSYWIYSICKMDFNQLLVELFQIQNNSVWVIFLSLPHILKATCSWLLVTFQFPFLITVSYLILSGNYLILSLLGIYPWTCLSHLRCLSVLPYMQMPCWILQGLCSLDSALLPGLFHQSFCDSKVINVFCFYIQSFVKLDLSLVL